jgi:hypothetical protein
MRGSSVLLFGSVVFACLSVSAMSAKAACYEEQVIESSLSCSSSSSSSADFGTGCVYTEPQVIQVEVACKSQWVNSYSATETHAAACARVGLKPTTDDRGYMCAAGERRPTTGEGWQAISYRYGKWGGGGGYGGKSAQFRGEYTYTTGNRDDRRTVTVPAATFCYSPGDKKDNDKTDQLVAYLCGP